MAYSQQPAGTASRGTFNPAYPHAQPAPSYLDYADPASTARLFPPPAQPVQSAGPAYAAWEHVYKPTEPKDYMESDIHYKDEKPCCGKCCQPGCCCCCVYRTWAKWTIAFICMLLLAGAGVAAYFCWPRGIPPKVSIVATEVSGASAINAVAPYSIHVPVTIRINVTSEMKIGIPLDSIVAEGSYTPASTGQPVKIAGGVLRDPYFAPESTTTLDIPFDVAYNSSDLGDPLINSLLEDCNIGTSGGKGTITIRWQATVVARLFTFVRVTTSGTEDVECPTASISASLVATTKSILGELGVDPNEVPDDASQLLPYLLQKAESLGIELPPNTNILQLATEVAKALGYDLNEVLKNGANIIGRFFGSRR